ncbi:MAG: hypothetical protein Q9227_009420 [Pyrenula ochraceoflavens]
MAPLVWLITGTSTGFGREIALAALSRGDHVIATARNPSKLTSLASLGASTLALDVTSPVSTINACIQSAHAIHSRIDILVNNAGAVLCGAVEEIPDAQTKATFNTNVFGALNVTRACLPYMRAQRSGRIAMISSYASWSAGAGLSMYCATKWAMSAFSLGLARELAEFGIEVCSFEPGYFKTAVLSSGSRLEPEHPMPEYDGTAAHQTMQTLEKTDQSQKGDAAQAAKVIVDVMTKSGVAEGKGGKIPLRLAIGADAYGLIKGIAKDYLEEYDEWREVSEAAGEGGIEEHVSMPL